MVEETEPTFDGATYKDEDTETKGRKKVSTHPSHMVYERGEEEAKKKLALIHSRADRAAKDNNLSKAMALITKASAAVLASITVYEKLETKFPQDSLWGSDNVELLQRLWDTNPAECLQVDGEDIRNLVRKLKTGVKPGIDKLRNEHLKQLCGKRLEPTNQESQFCSMLAEIINIFLLGKEPPGVSQIMRDCELFAAAKGDDDYRPICISSTLRKVVAMTILKASHEQVNEPLFEDLQFAMKKNGMEQILHSFQLTMEKRPNLTIMNVDGENAFNLSNRMCGLSAIEKNFPAALPHLRNMYSDNPDLTDEEPRDSYTRAWYYGLEDGIQFIKCTNGFHQRF